MQKIANHFNDEVLITYSYLLIDLEILELDKVQSIGLNLFLESKSLKYDVNDKFKTRFQLTYDIFDFMKIRITWIQNTSRIHPINGLTYGHVSFLMFIRLMSQSMFK